MRKALIFLLLLGFSYPMFAQVITIKDIETSEPLELVSLLSHQPHAFTTTNAQGQADISAFKGSERIEIRILGYKAVTKTFAELETQGFELFLTPSAVNIDEVVVSATRWNQTSNDIPSKVTAISPKKVSLQNPQTAADLLNISGQVFIQKSQQGGGSPMIRGFATNRLLYTIDGIRMNTAIFRGGNLQNVISLDPFSIEKTEVLFGPGSVIYGSDAIGGVMSFQTLTPQLSLTEKPYINGKAAARYSSSNNEKTGHFDVNIGWKKWAMISNISSNDYGDLRMGSHGRPEEYLRPFYVQRQDSADVIVENDDPLVQRPSGYSQINMMQKIRYKPDERWDIQYGFHYSETSPYSRYDRHIRYRNGLPRYGEWSYGPQKWMMNNLNISYNEDKSIFDQISMRLAYQFFEESRRSRNINDTIREVRIEKVHAYSANLDFVKSIGSRNNLYYGIEVVWNNVNSTGLNENIISNDVRPGPGRYPQSTWASYAVYISDQFTISDKITMQAGLRYNQFHLDAEFDTSFYPFPFTTADLNEGSLTGSLGIVYRPTPRWVISSNIATAFRSPNVDDAGKVFDSEPGSVVVPNPDLKAEYAYTAELGIARIFGDAVKVDITAYYTLLKNAMVRRDYVLNNMDSIVYDGIRSQVQAIQNAAEAHVYGLQLGFEAQLPLGFELTSEFSYQKGEEELDDGSASPARHAPPWFGVTRLSYSANSLDLQIYAVYNGEKGFEDLAEEEKGKDYIYAVDDDGNPYSPAWYTVNLKGLYHFSEHFTISAGLENLTDQRYRPYSSGIAASGRNFILSIKATF